MVPMLMVAIQVVNPGYVAPLLRGWGLLALGLCAMSVVVGTAVILRMAKIDV
jgi:Flp pilus assembly protein TadB